MTKREFEIEVTPDVLNGIGAGVSNEMWNEIEQVYMNTNLTKMMVADMFWNHTGRWSSLAAAVKAKVDAERALNDAKEAVKDSIALVHRLELAA